MRLLTGPSARPGVQGGIKLARLLELPERGAEEKLRELMSDPLFRKLAAAGVVSFRSNDSARFAARQAQGFSVRASTEGIGALLDGHGDLARLIERVGQERFTECFLSGSPLDDAQRAARCGLSLDEARRLRELVDRLYVQAELEEPAARPEAAAPPTEVCSAVAGISVEDGKPCLAFFHRDLWKGRWLVDASLRDHLAAGLTPAERRRLNGLLLELEQLERRKSTLLKVLEAVLEVQASFLVSRDPARRVPFTQRALAAQVGSDPSVINRLIANKSVELPWGLEAPLHAFVPSAKAIMRERLHELALEAPGASDERLRAALLSGTGAKLSRRSVAQYRKELGLAGRGKRVP